MTKTEIIYLKNCTDRQISLLIEPWAHDYTLEKQMSVKLIGKCHETVFGFEEIQYYENDILISYKGDEVEIYCDDKLVEPDFGKNLKI